MILKEDRGTQFHFFLFLFCKSSGNTTQHYQIYELNNKCNIVTWKFSQLNWMGLIQKQLGCKCVPFNLITILRIVFCWWKGSGIKRSMAPLISQNSLKITHVSRWGYGGSGSIPGTLAVRWEYILNTTPTRAHNYAFNHTLIHNYGQFNLTYWISVT